ncbi:MAG: PRK06851 family protein [Candidatus Wallacebacter cryptica]|jgi:hypothetical protein|nr:ATPase [Bacillota bacterium]
MGRVRKFFAGGITPQGFHSFFDQIAAGVPYRVYILKGGPGTGKSTLMMKIAERMSALGYDIEQFHCSSDADSLDGVAVPALKAAVVDGTAPHIIEPKYPGCVERVINLGEFWDADQIASRREQIIELTDENKACYPRAYRYLRAAKELHNDMCEINKSCMDFAQVNQVIKNLVLEIFGNWEDQGRLGRIRRLFASAYTPQGQVNELHSIMEDFPIQFIIKGEPGAGRDLVMERIADYASARGCDVEAYHCPLDPTRIDHLALPQLGTALISSYPPHIYEKRGAEVVNLNDYLDHYRRSHYQYTLHKNFVLFEELVNLALGQLRRAKAIHDDLELNYVRFMDFTKFDEIQEQIIADILAEQSNR